MTCKIYLEPRALFDRAIVEDTESKATYCYFKIIDLLFLDSNNVDSTLHDALLRSDREERSDVLDEYYWYNIEPLKSYYHIDFIYDHDKYLGDDSWNIQL